MGSVLQLIVKIGWTNCRDTSKIYPPCNTWIHTCTVYSRSPLHNIDFDAHTKNHFWFEQPYNNIVVLVHHNILPYFSVPTMFIVQLYEQFSARLQLISLIFVHSRGKEAIHNFRVFLESRLCFEIKLTTSFGMRRQRPRTGISKLFHQEERETIKLT